MLKIKNIKRLIIICILYTVSGFYVSGQGVNIQFGQNRINHQKREWKTIENEDFTILFYEGGEKHAKYVAEHYIQLKKIVQEKIKYRTSTAVNIVLFNNQSDYLQSNMDMVNPEFNYAGRIKMVTNKMTIYYEGSEQKFRNLIKTEICNMISNEMVYGGSINERFQNAALIILPTWYREGLNEYIGKGWDTEIDNWARDFFLNKKFKTLEELSKVEQINAGRSIWYYLEKIKGDKVISDIMFRTSDSRNYESGIYFSTGFGLNRFVAVWKNYFTEYYKEDVQNKNGVFGTEKIPKKLSKLPTTQFSIAPKSNGEQVAFVVNDNGKYSIWYHEFNLGITTKLLTGGSKVINKAINYDFPLISWHNGGKVLGLIVYQEGKYILKEYKIDKGIKIVFEKDLSELSYIQDFKFLSGNNSVIVSGVKNGQSDIFKLENIHENMSMVQMTDDVDVEKQLFIDGENVIYVKENKAAKGFFYSIVDLKGKLLYKAGPRENIKQITKIKEGQYLFLSDKSGIYNSYVLIDGVDSTFALSNYNRNIIFQSYSPEGEFGADLLMIDGQYHISSYTLSKNVLDDVKEVKISNSKFKREILRDIRISKFKKKDKKSNISKTKKEITYPQKIQSDFEKIDYTTNEKEEEKSKKIIPKLKSKTYYNRYQVTFVTTQFDNSYLGTYYFPTELHPDFLNQGIFNLLMKAQINDITNDIYMEGGMRLTSTLDGANYFFKAGFLKGRIDKKFDFYRRSQFIDYQTVYQRSLTNGAAFTLAYPIIEKLRIEGSALVRSDKLITLSGSNLPNLELGDVNRSYYGFKSQLIFDNTISTGLNDIKGMRASLLLENHTGLNHNASINVLGIDFRNYQPIHRGIRFATRINLNTSFGKNKMLYRVGGVDNWVEPSIEVNNLEVSDYENQQLQMLAGNMRGFNQNTLKGNSFFIMNNEFRIPIVRYLMRKNIRSNFFRNFMVVPFLDIGTAWTGNSPWSLDNPNNIIEYSQDFYTIRVRAARDPLIYSKGFGFRSKILGYLIKYDVGWGTKENKTYKPVHHFSIGVDF